MRLLDVDCLIYGGTARLIECNVSNAPPYAILSHTWSSEEVLFQDIALGPDYNLHEAPTPYPPKPTRRLCLTAFSQSNWSATETSAICEKCKVKQSGRSSMLAPKLRGRPKDGWNKVANACLRACKDGHQYIWIDTCCIDKSSSAELSEAINSMFEWYARSEVCYVYLEDCVDCPLRTRKDDWLAYIRAAGTLGEEERLSGMSTCIIEQLRSCKWLTRGWTLQELIAPEHMTFIDKNWVPLYDRFEIQHTLHDVTGIPRELFDRVTLWLQPYHRDPVKDLHKRLRQFSVVEKMSWAGSRQTTRSEDIAYSLLGIFGVNLPLLYGEGERAFSRLQEAIMKVNVDQTILAWEFDVPMWSDTEIYKNMLLAPDPRHFDWWRFFKKELMNTAPSINEPSITWSMKYPESFELANAGLQISLRCLDASTVRRTAVRLFSIGPEESRKPTQGQASESEEHNELGVDEENVDQSCGNIGLEENHDTNHNSTSTSVSDSNNTTNSDHDEARRGHEGSVSCALLDCVLELGGTTYAIAIQLQHVQAGDRYKASAAIKGNLLRRGSGPHRKSGEPRRFGGDPHRLLFMKAEAVEGIRRRAILIRHDHTAWYF